MKGCDKLAITGLEEYNNIYFTVIGGPQVHQSLTGSSIYLSGRAPQRTTITECTLILCMVLFQDGNNMLAIHSTK